MYAEAMKVCNIYTARLSGLNVHTVTIEVDLSKGLHILRYTGCFTLQTEILEHLERIFCPANFKVDMRASSLSSHSYCSNPISF